MPRDHVAEGSQIHLGGIGGAIGRHARGQRQDDEEGASEQLRCADDDPSWAGQKDGQAMTPFAMAVRRQEAQEIGLFADL